MIHFISEGDTQVFFVFDTVLYESMLQMHRIGVRSVSLGHVLLSVERVNKKPSENVFTQAAGMAILAWATMLQPKSVISMEVIMSYVFIYYFMIAKNRCQYSLFAE